MEMDSRITQISITQIKLYNFKLILLTKFKYCMIRNLFLKLDEWDTYFLDNFWKHVKYFGKKVWFLDTSRYRVHNSLESELKTMFSHSRFEEKVILFSHLELKKSNALPTTKLC